MSSEGTVVIVGGGVAALMAAWELAAANVDVLIASPTEPAKWPEVSDGGMSLGADAEALAQRTLTCGGDRADAAAVNALASAASGLVERLARIGVPFEREHGDWKVRRLPGNDRADAAHVGTHTELAIAGALERLLYGRFADRVTVIEPQALMSLVLDDGACRGVVLLDLLSGEVAGFAADAVILAGGGPERLLGARTGGICPELPLAIAAQHGAEMIDMHLCQQRPAAIQTRRGWIVPSGAVRAEGARLWTPAKEGDNRPPQEIPNKGRNRFLHAADAEWAELISDREATTIARAHGSDLFLDLSHFPEAHLRERLGLELEALRLSSGVDPSYAGLPVEPRPLGLLGGLRVDDDHASSIPGLFAAGRLASRYHGLCELGGNRLLADVHGGEVAGRAAVDYVGQISASDVEALVETAVTEMDEAHAERAEGGFGDAHRELFDTLSVAAVDVLGAQEYELAETAAEIDDLEGQLDAMPAQVRAGESGAAELFTLENMFVVARFAAACALAAAEQPEPRLVARLVDETIEVSPEGSDE